MWQSMPSTSQVCAIVIVLLLFSLAAIPLATPLSTPGATPMVPGTGEPLAIPRLTVGAAPMSAIPVFAATPGATPMVPGTGEPLAIPRLTVGAAPVSAFAAAPRSSAAFASAAAPVCLLRSGGATRTSRALSTCAFGLSLKDWCRDWQV